MFQKPTLEEAKEKASKFKSQLKAEQKARKLLTDPAEQAAAKERVKALQEEYDKWHGWVEYYKCEARWEWSVGREFDCIGAGE